MEKMKDVICIVIITASVILTLAHCSSDNSPKNKQARDKSSYNNFTLITNQDRVMSFEEFLDANGFKDSPIANTYVYEGDILFSRKRVESLYKDYVASMKNNTGTRGYVNNAKDYQHCYISTPLGDLFCETKYKPYLWNDEEKLDLSYSFETSMEGIARNVSAETIKQAFREATKAWMSAANVIFYEVPTGGRIKIRADEYDYAVTWRMSASYPNMYPSDGDKNTLNINKTTIRGDNSIVCTNASCLHITGIFVHELGHLLGLAHEQNRTDTPSDYSNLEEYRDGGGKNYGTEFDLDSVMNYYNSQYRYITDEIGNRYYYKYYTYNYKTKGRWLSDGDIEIIQILYGPPVTTYATPCDMPKGLNGGEKLTCCDANCGQ